MTDVLAYFHIHFVLAFFVICIGAALVPLSLNFAFRCWNRFFRCLMVIFRGWPPEHLDADGDWNEYK